MERQQEENQRLMIYQVFPRILTNRTSDCIPYGSLSRNGCGKMNDYTPCLLSSIKDLGINAIWFTGIIEHATKTDFPEIEADNGHVVKGEAGSPYAIKDYYDVAPALAENVDNRMGEFEDLVKRTHDVGMKVIIDFVPNHTARCYHSDVAPEGTIDLGAEDNTEVHFSSDNNYYYFPGERFSPDFSINTGRYPEYLEYPAKATGNDCFSAYCSENDWYETAKLNYGRDYINGRDTFAVVPDTWQKMLQIVKFWASKGVDGFRCDMVFMVPKDFWHWMIPQVKTQYPDMIFIGEIYDPWLYRDFLNYCGFDYLYDKVGLYDTLKSVVRHEMPASALTNCWQSLEGIRDRMLNFIENHDEVRFASNEFAGNPLRVFPALVVSTMISKSPFLLYYGEELGLDGEENEGFAGNNHRTTIFDYWSYDVLRRWTSDCSLENLSAQERWLRDLYAKTLKLCNDNEALRSGAMYDLTYAQFDNPNFDTDSQFAFIRYINDEAVLVLANFADENKYTQIFLPQELFDNTTITPGKYRTVDLYSGKENNENISEAISLKFIVPPNSAKVIKFTRTKH